MLVGGHFQIITMYFVLIFPPFSGSYQSPQGDFAAGGRLKFRSHRIYQRCGLPAKSGAQDAHPRAFSNRVSKHGTLQGKLKQHLPRFYPHPRLIQDRLAYRQVLDPFSHPCQVEFRPGSSSGGGKACRA